MVAEIIGAFLVDRGIISKGQMLVIQKERQKVRAQLGLIAVSEGYMTANEVKELYLEIGEQLSNRAFADAAFARGYLSEGQIKSLAFKQNDSYLCFAQTLEKLKIMDVVSLEEILREFPFVSNEVQLHDLKSNDVNRTIPLFIPSEAENYINAACTAIRYLVNKVGNEICPGGAILTDCFPAANGVFGFAKGEKEYTYALIAENHQMAGVATCYMRERFDGVNEEILEVISEIVNKMSSSYASELSQDGVVIDLMPPQVYLKMEKVIASEMLVLPLTIKNDTVYLLICMSNDIKIY